VREDSQSSAQGRTACARYEERLRLGTEYITVDTLARARGGYRSGSTSNSSSGTGKGWQSPPKSRPLRSEALPDIPTVANNLQLALADHAIADDTKPAALMEEQCNPER
jgi:hypothetical protein